MVNNAADRYCYRHRVEAIYYQVHVPEEDVDSVTKVFVERRYITCKWTTRSISPEVYPLAAQTMDVLHRTARDNSKSAKISIIKLIVFLNVAFQSTYLPT